MNVASSYEVTSCWTGRNAPWKPQNHTKVIGLLEMEEHSLQGAFLPGLACCGRRRPSIVASCRITWVTRVSFTWSSWHGDSSDRKCSCCLCAPHICLIILKVFRRFLLSPPMPSQELWNGLWIEGGMPHRLHFQLQHLGLLGTSSLFISVLHCRRKFSLLRTTSGWYLCFSNSKHCWDS